jgi:hypothetical protein
MCSIKFASREIDAPVYKNDKNPARRRFIRGGERKMSENFCKLPSMHAKQGS